MRPTLPSGLAALLAVLVLAPPAPVAAQDAQSILDTMTRMQADRWASVDNYTIVKGIDIAAGLQTPQYFVKMDVDGQPAFRLVLPPVYEREMLEAAGFPPPSPEQYEQMAMGYDMLGSALEQGGGDQPPMPGISGMTSQMSTFLRAGAEGVRNLDDGSADAAQAVADMESFAAMAEYAGTEPVQATSDGQMRDAHRLEVDGIEMTQAADGGSFTLRSATMWIDTEEYVPYRLVMEGEMERDGESTPLTIERLDQDYRSHGSLYVAHREVGRISGLMDAMSESDREQMEEAREQIAEAEAQLAAMPDGAAKAMAERMMLPQIERFREMIEGGSFEAGTGVVSVAVNEGPPTPYGLGSFESRPALTLAAEIENSAAELSIMAGPVTGDEATFTLTGTLPYPEPGGTVPIVDASGELPSATGGRLNLISGSGAIRVTERTETHIVGEYEAQLTGTDEDGVEATVTVAGAFDSGAPMGPFQAPRGSPIPAMFGQQQGP